MLRATIESEYAYGTPGQKLVVWDNCPTKIIWPSVGMQKQAIGANWSTSDCGVVILFVTSRRSPSSSHLSRPPTPEGEREREREREKERKKDARTEREDTTERHTHTERHTTERHTTDRHTHRDKHRALSYCVLQWVGLSAVVGVVWPAAPLEFVTNRALCTVSWRSLLLRFAVGLPLVEGQVSLCVLQRFPSRGRSGAGGGVHSPHIAFCYKISQVWLSGVVGHRRRCALPLGFATNLALWAVCLGSLILCFAVSPMLVYGLAVGFSAVVGRGPAQVMVSGVWSVKCLASGEWSVCKLWRVRMECGECSAPGRWGEWCCVLWLCCWLWLWLVGGEAWSVKNGGWSAKSGGRDVEDGEWNLLSEWCVESGGSGVQSVEECALWRMGEVMARWCAVVRVHRCACVLLRWM